MRGSVDSIYILLYAYHDIKSIHKIHKEAVYEKEDVIHCVGRRNDFVIGSMRRQ